MQCWVEVLDRVHNRVSSAWWAAFLLAICLWSTTHAQIVTSTWDGVSTANWGEVSNWNNEPSVPEFPNNTNSENSFHVVIDDGSVNLDQNITISELNMGFNPAALGAFVSGASTLTVEQDVEVESFGGFRGIGTLNVSGNLQAEAGFEITGWTVGVDGSTTLGASSSGTVNLDDGARLNTFGDLTISGSTDVLGNTTGTPRINANGSVIKNVSGTADIGVDLVSASGQSIRVDEGTLRFLANRTVTLNGGQLQTAAANSSLVFLGNTQINGNTLITSPAGASTVIFQGGNTVLGSSVTLTSAVSDTGTTSVTMEGGSISGGRLLMDPNNKFIASGDIGTSAQVRNDGAFEWKSGRITGSGFANLNNTAGQTRTHATATGLIVENGTFSNSGHFTQDRLVTLNQGGLILNSGTYHLDGASIAEGSGVNPSVSQTEFLNIGTGVVEVTGFVPFNANLFIQDAGGQIVVRDGGELRLQGSHRLRGTARIDTSTASLSRLAYNATGPSTSGSSEDMTYQFVGDGTGEVRFQGGTNLVSGMLTSSGSGSVRLTGGVLQVPDEGAATLNMTATAPFVFDAPSLSTRIRTEGSLTNQGTMVWARGEVVGPQPLQNQGTINVTGTMRIGDNGEAGEVNNTKTINIASGAGGIGIHGSARLNNTASNGMPGLVDIQGNGDIFQLSAPIQELFENTGGELRKSGPGFSQVSVPFRQTSGKITVRDGTLTLNSSPQLLGGEVEVTNTAGTTPVLRFSSPSTTENGNITFNDGRVEYGTGSGNHIFRGTLNGSGTNGEVRLPGGTYSVNSTATFGISGDNTFLNHLGGTISGSGAVTNTGNYLFQNGSIANDGGFTNHGTFEWIGGQINTAITNENAEGAMNPANFVIESNTVHTLPAGSELENRATITHIDAAVLRLGENAKVRNRQGAVYEFPPESTGSIDKASAGTTGTEFVNEGTIRRTGTLTNETIDLRVAVPFVNTELGIIEVTTTAAAETNKRLALNLDGGGRLNGGQVRLNGQSAWVIFDGFRVNRIHHVFSYDGNFSRPLAFYHDAAVVGSLTGTGNGNATLFGPGNVPAGSVASLDFRDASSVSLGDGFGIFGRLNNLGELDIKNGNIVFSNTPGSGGRLSNEVSGTIQIQNFLNPNEAITLTGSTSSATLLPGILNTGTIEQNSDLQLVGHIRISNFRRHELNSASIRVSDTNGGGDYVNQGTFISDPGFITTTNTIGLPFDNTDEGEVEARVGTTVFSNLRQYDATTQTLTGGSYTLRDRATVRIEGVDNISVNNAQVNLEGSARFEGLEGVNDNAGEVNIGDGQTFVFDNNLLNSGSVTTQGDDSTTTIQGNLTQTSTGTIRVTGDEGTPLANQPTTTVTGDANLQGTIIDEEARLFVMGVFFPNQGARIRLRNGRISANAMAFSNSVITASGTTNRISSPAGNTFEDTVLEGLDGGNYRFVIEGDTTAGTNASAMTIRGGEVEFTDDLRVASGGSLETFATRFLASTVNVDGTIEFNMQDGGQAEITEMLLNGGAASLLLPSLSEIIDQSIPSVMQIDRLTMENGGEFTGGFASGRRLEDDATDVVLNVMVQTFRNLSGTVNPGQSPGVLIVGDYEQGVDGRLNIELGGLDAAKDYDVVYATDGVSLDGELDLSLINDFQPAFGDTFNVVTAGSRTGVFSRVHGVEPESEDFALAPVYDYQGNVGLTIVTALPGDGDLNGTVALGDLGLLLDNLGGSGDWTDADFNGDGVVALGDLGVVLDNLGRSVPLSAPTHAVPEPSTALVVLLTTCLGGLFGRSAGRATVADRKRHSARVRSA